MRAHGRAAVPVLLLPQELSAARPAAQARAHPHGHAALLLPILSEGVHAARQDGRPRAPAHRGAALRLRDLREGLLRVGQPQKAPPGSRERGAGHRAPEQQGQARSCAEPLGKCFYINLSIIIVHSYRAYLTDWKVVRVSRPLIHVAESAKLAQLSDRSDKKRHSCNFNSRPDAIMSNDRD